MAYIDVSMLAVPDDRRAEYTAHAARFAEMFKRLGALDCVEAWGVDVPEGKRTCMNKAVAREPGESVVVSWIIWPDETVRNAGWAAAETDPVMVEFGADMPFDGTRLIYGAFESLFGV